MKRLPIDLEELCMALESDSSEMKWFLDTETGDVFPTGDMVDEQPDDLDSDRYLAVTSDGSRDCFRDMEEFIATVSPPLSERLDEALRGPKPFRRFKDVLSGAGAARDRWFSFQSKRQQKRAIAWLAQHDIEPAPKA